jgi:hypothetical protein
MTIDSGEPAGYVDPSNTISPEFRSGSVVWFLDVAPGPRTVVVYAPDGTPFDDAATIEVIADGATEVFVNLPAVFN